MILITAEARGHGTHLLPAIGEVPAPRRLVRLSGTGLALDRAAACLEAAGISGLHLDFSVVAALLSVVGALVSIVATLAAVIAAVVAATAALASVVGALVSAVAALASVAATLAPAVAALASAAETPASVAETLASVTEPPASVVERLAAMTGKPAPTTEQRALTPERRVRAWRSPASPVPISIALLERLAEGAMTVAAAEEELGFYWGPDTFRRLRSPAGPTGPC